MERFKLNLNILQENNGVIIIYDKEENFILHSKFCIIDNRVVITGSYNWTYSATRHIENIVIIDDSETAAKYAVEYERIRNKKFQSLMQLPIVSRCSDCRQVAVKIRIYDYYMKYDPYSEDVKEVLFCAAEPVGHLKVLKDFEEWPDELGETIRLAVQDINDTEDYNGITISSGQQNEMLGKSIAEYFGSTNDLFLENAKEQIYVIMKRTYDPETEGGSSTFKIVWCNPLYLDYAQVFIDFAEEIIEEIY